MARFSLRTVGRRIGLIAPSARTAIRAGVCVSAPAESELRDDDGVVISRKHRVEFDGGWIVAWVPTSAWPDREPPIDLEALYEDEGSAS